MPPSGARCPAGREPDAADHPLLPIYFYDQKAPGETRGRGLVRQRHERRLQQGSRTAAASDLAPRYCRRRSPRRSCRGDPRSKLTGDLGERLLRGAQFLGDEFPGARLAQLACGFLGTVARAGERLQMAPPRTHRTALHRLVAHAVLQVRPQLLSPVPCRAESTIIGGPVSVSATGSPTARSHLLNTRVTGTSAGNRARSSR